MTTRTTTRSNFNNQRDILAQSTNPKTPLLSSLLGPKSAVTHGAPRLRGPRSNWTNQRSQHDCEILTVLSLGPALLHWSSSPVQWLMNLLVFSPLTRENARKRCLVSVCYADPL